MEISLFDDSFEDKEPSVAEVLTPEQEIAKLREQVATLTKSGNELIGTQTRMQSLLHNASDAIIQFEADNTISSFNRAAEAVFDRAEIEVICQTGDQLFNVPIRFGDSAAIYLSHYARTVKDQYQDPLIGVRPDGSIRYLEVSVAEITSSNLMLFDDFSDNSSDEEDATFEAFLCILHDITERKAIDDELTKHRENLEEMVEEQVKEIREAKELAEQASQSKSEFLSNMSHELRTPMHAILSYSDFGLKKYATAKPEKIHQYFDRINTAGSRLITMINDLLDLAKAEAGKLNYKMEESSWNNVVIAVTKEYEALVEQKGLNLAFEPNMSLDGGQFDDERIGQVLRNFLSNAFKFTPEGSTVSISLSSDEIDYGENKLAATRLSVSDAGCGIPEDELDLVFEKFSQSSHNKKGAGGTGLGLAICSEIALAHAGIVGVNNNPDIGANFYVVIPHKIPEEILSAHKK